MPNTSKAPAGGRVLPTKLDSIRLGYRFDIGWDASPSDGACFWHVSADVHDLESDSITDHVGSFVFYRVEPLETEDLFEVMDGYDSDLSHIAEMIIDLETGEIHDELRDQLQGFESDVLVLCSAQLEEPWRGFGLGAVLAGHAIRQLGHGCLGAALQPASLLPRTKGDEQARKSAARKISKAWEKIGFTRAGDDLMVLDLAVTTFREALTRQCALIRRLPVADEVE